MRFPRECHPFLRFLASGAFNTVATYAAYVGLLALLSYRWSYTVAYVLGIVLAYVLSRYFVFGKSGGRYGVFWIVIIYGFQYVLGLGLVNFWVEVLHAPTLLAPMLAIVVSIPVSYLLSRLVFRGNKSDLVQETLK